MEVGHHHHIEVFGSHSMSGEIVQQLTPRGLRCICWLGPQACIDQDGPSICTHQKGAQVEADFLLRREVGRIWLPVFLRDGREKVAEIEFEQATLAAIYVRSEE